MKRLFAVLLIVLLLAGCGKQEPVAESVPTTEPVTEAPTTVPTTEATEPTTEPPTEAPTEPPIRHPLTGEILDEPFTGLVTSVSVNNIKGCLPQHGISQADMCYEIETESGITRILALFTQLEDIEKLGPVRSSRTFFNAISYCYQAPFVHCGAGIPARYGYLDNYVTKMEDWQHIDANVSPKYFYRDQDRLNQGVAYEHTLFTTGPNVLQALQDKEYAKVNENGLDFGLIFAEEPAIEGEPANTVTVSFKGSKTTTFTYDAATGLYTAHQYEMTHIDGNTEEPVTYRNVITLYTSHTKSVVSNTTRSFYELVGSGTGHMAVDGKIVPILWSHDSYEAPFIYTLADGTPLELGVGRTYFAITGGAETSYE